MAVLCRPIHPGHTRAGVPDPCPPRSPGSPALPVPSLGLPRLPPLFPLGPEDQLSRRGARRLGQEPLVSQQNHRETEPFPRSGPLGHGQRGRAPDPTGDPQPFPHRPLLCLSGHACCYHQTLDGPVSVRRPSGPGGAGKSSTEAPGGKTWRKCVTEQWGVCGPAGGRAPSPGPLLQSPQPPVSKGSVAPFYSWET